MIKRHEVEILLKAGHPKTEVARLSGVSLRSVKRIAEESPVMHVDDAAERGKTTDRQTQRGGEFPETGDGDSAGNARSSIAGDSAASWGKRLSRRQDSCSLRWWPRFVRNR
jgi:hypothetical protein